jgi:hypothetical protein
MKLWLCCARCNTVDTCTVIRSTDIRERKNKTTWWLRWPRQMAGTLATLPRAALLGSLGPLQAGPGYSGASAFLQLECGPESRRAGPVVNGAKQRALFGWYSHLCTANGPSAKAMGTHGPLDPAAPEGKPAPHMMGPAREACLRSCLICADPWDTAQ